MPPAVPQGVKVGTMRAVVLTGLDEFESLHVREVDVPAPNDTEVLIAVKAAGINYAELEQTRGRYPTSGPLPFIMGFEAAGEVVSVGSRVENLRVGDRVAGVTSSGGYAEYATLDAGMAIPIPAGLSYAQACTIPIQGVSAYALLKFAAKVQPHENVLIQAAAGGVGLYLVQLAKILGVRQIVALASSPEKLKLVRDLGAHVAIDYIDAGWAENVRSATAGRGADVVFEMASGRIGDESFRLIAPFGRVVFFGASNAHDSLPPEKVYQLISQNQSLIGFNVPALAREQLAECIVSLLDLIVAGRLQLFANNVFPLASVRQAFEALSSRSTIGKVVLVP